MFALLAVAAVLATAEPQSADPPTASPGPPAQSELQPGERRVKIKCRSEAINGSRVAKRRCMTLDEWKRLEDESAKALQEMQGRSPVVPTCQQSAMRPC
jgi:hypothetical protein